MSSEVIIEVAPEPMELLAGSLIYGHGLVQFGVVAQPLQLAQHRYDGVDAARRAGATATVGDAPQRCEPSDSGAQSPASEKPRP